MVQKTRSILLIVIGIVALGLSIRCFTFDDLGYETRSMYGGDAFTGIQNAAAITSKNVKDLAAIVQFGFGSILLITGISFIGFGLTSPMKSNKAIQENQTKVDPQVMSENSQQPLPTEVES